jgi:hypothetical protein
VGKQLSNTIAVAVAFYLLFVSVVYACSSLYAAQMTFHPSAASNGNIERGPCSEKKQDICQSVRYSMLSIQSSISSTKIALYASQISQKATVEIPFPFDFSVAALSLTTAFHPIFKLSLPFSYLVLRI